MTRPLRSRPDLLDALDDYFFSGFEPAHNLHLPRQAQTELDRSELHGAVGVHGKDDGAVAVQELAQGGLGNDNRVLADVHGQIKVGKHARLEFAIRIGDLRFDECGAGVRVHRGRDEINFALKPVRRISGHFEVQGLAQLHLA